MEPSLGESRLALVLALRGREREAARVDREALRFSLGVSAADLKVPFHVAPDAVGILCQSAKQLLLLLVSRHRRLLPPDDVDAFLLRDDFAALPEAPQTLAPTQGGPEVRAAAELAPRVHRLLTGGVLSTWMGPGGGGRSLVALTLELLRRGFAEMGEVQGREETPSLVALLWSTALGSAEAVLKTITLPPAHDRALRAAALSGVYLALRLAVERSLREHNAPEVLATRVRTALSPLVALGGRQGVLAPGVALYGHELTAGIPAVDEALAKLSSDGPAPAAEVVARALAASDELARAAELSVALSHVRGALLTAVAAGEQGGLEPDFTGHLRDLAMDAAQLSALLADEKGRKHHAKEWAATAPLAPLAQALKAYSEKEPAACAGLSRAKARAAYAHAAVCCAADLWLERALAPSKRALYPRTGSEEAGGIDAEYDGGRLYRLSVKPERLLRPQAQAGLGHLFVDVKDFTRRTSILGQAAMADFLRREFYVPILTAAKQHYGGMSQLSDRGGVSLNNLLGDAVSLSGDIAALVTVAREIRRHLLAYERQLAKSVSSDEVARVARSIDREYQRQALSPGADKARLMEEKQAALGRARGEGLEAGVFISHGPVPLVVTIPDDVFGESKVAIADKINESARGTARSGAARARYDALLSAERTRRGNPQLAHAWSVFIDAPFSVSVPAADAQAALGLARTGNLAVAAELLLPLLRSALEQACDAGPDAPGDIYNAGAALSGEALDAFREAMAGARTFGQLELLPASFHHDIQRRYFFPPEVIRLVVAFDADGKVAELFRYAGRTLFKGFEKTGGLPIWELVSDSGVGELLARFHGAEWLRQVRASHG